MVDCRDEGLEREATALRAELAALNSNLREFDRSMEERMDALRTDILRKMLRLMQCYVTVNVLTAVGTMFGVAELLGH